MKQTSKRSSWMRLAVALMAAAGLMGASVAAAAPPPGDPGAGRPQPVDTVPVDSTTPPTTTPDTTNPATTSPETSIPETSSPETSSPDASTTLPTAAPRAAVAMGDSFISGEGAGNYSPVVDISGTSQGFPGWSAANDNPYFCHRSPNAEIQVAQLDGIDARFNIACSGAQPADFLTPSASRPGGRGVAAQIDQLRAIAHTNNIDLVLIGIGSNNSQFTFGGLASECAGRFVADGYTGWWEFWVPFIAFLSGKPVANEHPCNASDFPSAAQMANARNETIDAIRAVLDALDEIDADGIHRVVIQDYTDPLPPDLNPAYFTRSGRTDTRDKFRALVDARYAAGCPIHRASLGPAQAFTAQLGAMVRDAYLTLHAERPAAALNYLSVQGAFDYARLCEQDNSPWTSLATPLRVQDGPTGVPVTSFSPYDKLDIARVTKACKDYYQTCQESWHPNAGGHQTLGRCLTYAWTYPSYTTVSCSRWWNGAMYFS